MYIKSFYAYKVFEKVRQEYVRALLTKLETCLFVR